MNNSYLAFSLHDPELRIYSLIDSVLPLIKANFSGIYMGITPATEARFRNTVESQLDKDFFFVNYNEKDSLVGDHHLSVYENALKQIESQDTLHLCTPDRLVYSAINYRESFFEDLMGAGKQSSPTLFVRSQKAWQTHPKNYCAIESMVTRLGEVLFNKSLDFAWCHLCLQAADLKEVMKRIESHDLTIYAEIVYYLRDVLQVKAVDWLAWEDPFIFGMNPTKYKESREADRKENEKRLGYVLPMIDFLLSKFDEE